MTDHPTGTGLPDDPADDLLGPETPGPEATPEQEALVTGLLASLRGDDPPVPDHVAARIDGVLAELRRSGPVVAGAPTALGDDPEEAGGTGGTGGGSSSNVLPLPAQRRGSSTSRTFRWVAGAAAAIVVVGAGAAVVRGALPGTGSGAATMSAEDASGGTGAKAAAPIRTSGTDYTSSELASQAQSLLARTPAGGEVAPEAGPGDGGSGSPSPGTASPSVAGARGLLTTDTLAACLEQLTAQPAATPLAVDQGSYEGKPADVVVLPSPDDPERLEVWVIGPGCTRESVELYEFRTIPSPGAGTGASSSP